MRKSYRTAKIGNAANWLGEMNERPKFFTKYTAAGLLWFLGYGIWKLTEFVLHVILIDTIITLLLGAADLWPSPLTGVDPIQAFIAAAWASVCAWRLYSASKCRKKEW